ncbi:MULTISPECIES: glutamyl-tRNA reductase [Gammaproteobacteria]|uniref:glutamyl-tRNA reductase n=1 Tax=Gammaproteobacteria TaxID=1236 RepID=UPI000DD08622|nr:MULTISPECIES: glutamyl-tRNA reductase [Gammaproteobacteria]RTE87425.1 glutamyl-tRNA reductase [Aliidiomarina sp. B3213]TCZ92790.1 glutamyl-tRNA reductase [Lysobacter sp. N42]
MTILAVGINHTTATVDIRERVAFQPKQLESALQSMLQQGLATESVILSTCNRTELYFCAEQDNLEQVIEWLAMYHQVSKEELGEYVYQHQDELAIQHLMKVASGLDSLVLGEPQILGQVKEAYQAARNAGAIGSVFDRLFQNTFSAAKSVRTETQIGQNAVSVAYSAVNLAKHIFDSLEKAEVLIVGAGDTAELAARHLKDQGVRKLNVANRTQERAEELTSVVGGKAWSLDQLQHLLPQADIVISSTASPVPVIGKGWVETAIKQRKHKPMLFIDLAVPRDIEEEVGELNDVYLYTVDDLQKIVSQNKEQRQQAAKEASEIIARHVSEFEEWMRSLNAVSLLREYRVNVERIAQIQKEKALNAIAAGKPPEEVIHELATKLANTLAHKPTTAIQNAAKKNDLNALAAYQQLIHQEAEE